MSGSEPASAIRTTLNPKASACLHPGGVGTCFVLLAASRAPLLGGSVDPAVFTATDARQTVHLLRFERRPRGVYRGRRSANRSFTQVVSVPASFARYEQSAPSGGERRPRGVYRGRRQKAQQNAMPCLRRLPCQPTDRQNGS